MADKMDVDSESFPMDVQSTSNHPAAIAGSSKSQSQKQTTAAAGGSSAGASTAATTPGAHVLAPASTSASVTVSLHPLVIMNISEHWTRIRAQEGKQQGNANDFRFQTIRTTHICFFSA